MTQKIFDTDNEEDMKLLWSILPTNTFKIRGMNSQPTYLFQDDNKCYGSIGEDIIKINWHDKTEIKRPVNYEDMIGCIGWFTVEDCRINRSDPLPEKILGRLEKVDVKSRIKIFSNGAGWFSNFAPAKKSELKFYGE